MNEDERDALLQEVRNMQRAFAAVHETASRLSRPLYLASRCCKGPVHPVPSLTSEYNVNYYVCAICSDTCSVVRVEPGETYGDLF